MNFATIECESKETEPRIVIMNRMSCQTCVNETGIEISCSKNHRSFRVHVDCNEISGLNIFF